MNRLLATGLACALALAGCSNGADPPTHSRSSDLLSVSLSHLPDLPGCGNTHPTNHGRVTLAEVTDDAALYVVYLGGTPVCVDDLQGIFGAQFLTDEDIARAFDGTPLPARNAWSNGDGQADDGTPLPAHGGGTASAPDPTNSDGTPLPARPSSNGNLTAAQAAADLGTSGTANDGTPLPAHGGGTTGGTSTGTSATGTGSNMNNPSKP